MIAAQKYRIWPNSIFSDGNGLIYKVNHFIWSDIDTYKYGEPVQDNVVHVTVYKENEDGSFEAIDNKDFLHIKDLFPLPIKESYLRQVGFTEQQHEGRQVFKCNNSYFNNLGNVAGVYTIHDIRNDAVNGVEFMHEVQILVRG